MKFGKEFSMHLEETLPEWRDKYLCYKLLKKLLKNIPAGDSTLNPSPVDGDDTVPMLPLHTLQDWFVGILNDELEKFNDFYVDKEEEFIIRFQVFSSYICISVITSTFHIFNLCRYFDKLLKFS